MSKNIYFSFLVIVISFTSFKVKGQPTDYALLANRNQWSHHYAFGSPSWDAFERFSNNPVYRGVNGMEWPVNGFLYADPLSKNWYLYIGEYKRNYEVDNDTTTKDMNCVILKSTDKGKTWNRVGDLFTANKMEYDSIKIQVPDVMITYADGKYHMIFDWVSDTFNWQQNAGSSGIGYAVANSPEGPFIVSKKPLKINSQYKKKPLLNKYWRMYAPMIFKQKNGWAIAYMLDTSPTGSWCLAVSTALKPEGPYSDTKIIMNVERKNNYAPLQEYYPAFTHKGYAYFPATSVSINRNYQSIYRVKIDEITNADKYEIFRKGSFWHAANVANEYAGIWGQTISGFIDETDSFYVMYPSKDPKNYGTINLAKASWNNLDRKKGFNFTANEGNSFSYLKTLLDLENIGMKFKLDGTMHLIWDFHSKLDIQNEWGKFSLNEKDGNYKEIIIDKNYWIINEYGDDKNSYRIDSGKIPNFSKDENNLQIKKTNGKYLLLINGVKCWEGVMKSKPGVVGIALNPNSFLFTEEFVVNARKLNGHITYGFHEALLNSGNYFSDWNIKTDSLFFYGQGAISKKDSCFAKWNFDGIGFELLLPKGPQYGTVFIYLDGTLVKKISLKNQRGIKSSIVFKSNPIKRGNHSVYIESLDGVLPVDCINIKL